MKVDGVIQWILLLVVVVLAVQRSVLRQRVVNRVDVVRTFRVVGTARLR